MSNDAIFYRRQADAERENAANATLDNVRDRSTRAADTWDTMANRAERTQKARDQRSPSVTPDDTAPDAP